MAGAGDAGVGAGAWPDAACSSGFANMVMNLDFLSGLGFAEMVSTGGISADLSLPQLPKRMPCVGSAPEGVCRGAVSMGGAVMEMAVDVSAGTSLDSSFSPAGVSLALICSFQRWKSSCVRGLNSFSRPWCPSILGLLLRLHDCHLCSTHGRCPVLGLGRVHASRPVHQS